MKKILKNKKGFTLMEMLIVVAIIVILVVISIPIFTSQLDKAKTAADDANLRAAKGAAATMMLTDDSFNASTTYYFDAEAGKLGTGAPSDTEYGQMGTNGYIKVTFPSGEVKCEWVDKDGNAIP